MNIITWNCNMAFRNKYDKILHYKPDLLIVPECESLEKHSNKFYHNALWIGENKNKGLGVFSFNNIDITIHESYCEDYKYVLPIKVTNPKSQRSTNLIAIWSQDNKEDPKRRYIGEVWNSLNYYKEMLGHPIIIAGDFNWNIIWDKKPKSSLYGNFTDVINLLNQFEIYSAYHEYNEIKFGSETEPTLFLNYNEHKPYHIDYIFASAPLINQVKSVFVGKYADWRPYKSDHMPLMIEFEDIL